uniref:Uncharacterized protein n=1 Tax=Anguilla anguilla TaxID=7936 RepID=A0A0E9SMF0_ANGAN
MTTQAYEFPAVSWLVSSSWGLLIKH